MAFSYAIFGILVMLDVSFITNYFVIKALRKWTDARTEDSYHALTDDGTKAETAEYPASLLETILFGWVLGKIKPDPYSAQRFPAWKPIPLYFGLTTTSGLILITLAFLSPQFMFKQFGITFTGAPTTTQVCDPDTKNRTLIELNNTLKEMLNFDAAMDQFNTLRGMTEALQKDTLLYGTPGFTCKGTKVVRSNGAGSFSLDGTINQWTDPDKRFKFPAAKWGTYFPGYCRAFHDAERKLDSLAVCGPRTICQCPKVPSTDFFRFMGWAGKEVCALQVCLTFDNIPCGALADYTKNLFPPNNYRVQQLNSASNQQSIDIGQQKFPNTAQDINTNIPETFTKLMNQIDLAANVYAVYAMLSLYFPSPIYIFRKPFYIAVTSFTFGVNKNVFMIGVIAIWWLYSYIGVLFYNPDIQILFANIRIGDPCYLDGKYIIDRQSILSNLCNTILPAEQNFSIHAGTATSIIDEVVYFAKPSADKSGCDCNYPMKNLQPFTTENFSENRMAKLGFTRTALSMNNVFLPTKNFTFLGNLTVCNDGPTAKKIILQPPDTEFTGFSPFDMWFKSGLLAALIIKFIVTNFVISLLRSADPFVVCGGEFLWIPSKFGLGLDGQKLDKASHFFKEKRRKEKILRFINLRDLLWWGFLMHMCLLNLIAAAYSTSRTVGVQNSDVAVLKLTMTVGALIMIAGILFICALKADTTLGRRKGRVSDKASVELVQ